MGYLIIPALLLAGAAVAIIVLLHGLDREIKSAFGHKEDYDN